MWELSASRKSTRYTLRFLQQFLRCPQQHGCGALACLGFPRKAQEDRTLTGPRFNWEIRPPLGGTNLRRNASNSALTRINTGHQT